MEKLIKKRISAVLSSLKINTAKDQESKDNKTYSAMLLSSAPHRIRSHDTEYPYRQSSDFFYLSGSNEVNQALLISDKFPKPRFYALKETPLKIIWEGKSENPRNFSVKNGYDLIISENIKREIVKDLQGVETLFYGNEEKSLSFEIAKEFMNYPADRRNVFPRQFKHAHVILEKMRTIKTPEEVALIERAAKVTNHALLENLELVTAGTYEYQIAAAINFVMAVNNCPPAFRTIVASGASAAALHYSTLQKKLKKDDLLLVDWGAEHKMYSADISRTIPVSGKFSEIQARVYNIVLKAQQKSITKIKHGATLKSIYEAAVQVLTEGLHELGVLKGSVEKSIKSGAFKRYFPHGIGHSLGIDTHDIGDLKISNNSKLQKGMVFTVEPGLYFSVPTKSKYGIIPPMGIRIEDDVLVKENGRQVISGGFPKEVEEIEEIIAESMW